MNLCKDCAYYKRWRLVGFVAECLASPRHTDPIDGTVYYHKASHVHPANSDCLLFKAKR